jgi:hypothetical protein
MQIELPTDSEGFERSLRTALIVGAGKLRPGTSASYRSRGAQAALAGRAFSM